MKTARSACEGQTFYLYTPSSSDPVLNSNNVFYKVSGEQLANTLCRLFCKEHLSESLRPSFFVKSTDEVDQDEQILLD
jgi:hypothetical protein